MIELRYLENAHKVYRADDSFNVDIIPDRAFRVFGKKVGNEFNKMFEMGMHVNCTGYEETTEYGVIEKISEKHVTIRRESNGGVRRMKYYNFIWKNA